MPKFLNKILNIKSEYESDSKEGPDSKKKQIKNIKKLLYLI